MTSIGLCRLCLLAPTRESRQHRIARAVYATERDHGAEAFEARVRTILFMRWLDIKRAWLVLLFWPLTGGFRAHRG